MGGPLKKGLDGERLEIKRMYRWDRICFTFTHSHTKFTFPSFYLCRMWNNSIVVGVGDCFMRRNHVPGEVQIHYFWLKSAVKLVVLCLFVTCYVQKAFFCFSFSF